jgi:hypothetical protein
LAWGASSLKKRRLKMGINNEALLDADEMITEEEG